MDDYTLDQQRDTIEEIGTADNGMVGVVWQGDSGWYGEVADPGNYCQGAAWGTDKAKAISAVKQEIEQINDCVAKGY